MHFRQDHARITQWIRELSGTRWDRFLARVLLRNGEVFTFERDGVWVVFYEEAPRRGVLPRVLSEAQIDNLASEMALFHKASAEIAPRLAPTWQSLGSDLAALYDQMQHAETRAARELSPEHGLLIRRHCDLFFNNAERLGYHNLPKLPVLTDWNRGNFSVAYDEHGFTLFSRWDYDWFRIEPRALDFYFFSRVVREEGDQTVFSYTASPLLEPRFLLLHARLPRGLSTGAERAGVPQGGLPLLPAQLRGAHGRALLLARVPQAPRARGRHALPARAGDDRPVSPAALPRLTSRERLRLT